MKRGGRNKLKRLNCMGLCFLLSILAARLMAAPLPQLDPADVTGTISALVWIPQKEFKGIPGLSGTAGQDRVMAAHFLVTLSPFAGVEEGPASLMSEFVAPGGAREANAEGPGKILMLKLEHQDATFLKKGMQIRITGYCLSGDEGGTWTSYREIRILSTLP